MKPESKIIIILLAAILGVLISMVYIMGINHGRVVGWIGNVENQLAIIKVWTKHQARNDYGFYKNAPWMGDEEIDNAPDSK